MSSDDWQEAMAEITNLRKDLAARDQALKEAEQKLADMTADYFRRHKDAGDEMEKRIAAESQVARMREETLEEAAKVCDKIAQRDLRIYIKKSIRALAK